MLNNCFHCEVTVSPAANPLVFPCRAVWWLHTNGFHRPMPRFLFDWSKGSENVVADASSVAPCPSNVANIHTVSWRTVWIISLKSQKSESYLHFLHCSDSIGMERKLLHCQLILIPGSFPSMTKLHTWKWFYVWVEQSYRFPDFMAERGSFIFIWSR